MTDSQDNLLLFREIEHRARNYTLDGVAHPFDWHARISGLLSPEQIEAELGQLEILSVDGYIARVLDPAESPQRASAKVVIQGFRGKRPRLPAETHQ